MQVANAWKYNIEDPEREQRRKYRVEKKLQEMEEHKERNLDPLQDAYHDIVEYAQKHFNSHERTPEGRSFEFTITAPLINVGAISQRDNVF